MSNGCIYFHQTSWARTSYGIKTAYVKIDEIVTPQEEHLKKHVESKCADMIDTSKRMSGGLPEGGQLTSGLDYDKCTLPTLMSVYNKAVKDGVMNNDFAKSMKSHLDLITKECL